MFFGDKILHLESDFRKLGSVAVLRSLIRILRASLALVVASGVFNGGGALGDAPPPSGQTIIFLSFSFLRA